MVETPETRRNVPAVEAQALPFAEPEAVRQAFVELAPDSTRITGRLSPKFETSRLLAADALSKAAGPYHCHHPRYIDSLWTWPLGATLFF